MKLEPGKIGLVGSGAVGSFYGLMLMQSGMDVNFHLRSNFKEVKKDGFLLIHHSKSKKNRRIKNPKIYQNTEGIGICDWIIIATKASANRQIPSMISPMVGKNTSFLTLQNGMGNVENLTNAFGENRLVVGGLCFTCINRTSPTKIESFLPGYIQFGQLGVKLSNKALVIVKSFENSGIQVRTSNSLEEALWHKLCWNIPFNGLSIVGGGITTDIILSSPELKKRAVNLMYEIQDAAKAYGIFITDSFLKKQFFLTESMGAYKPSSLIDFLARKPVEVEAIWGEALRRGLRKELKMKELTNLYDELRKLT